MNNSDNFARYKINRILNLSFLAKIILHESIHYYKRMLYYISYGMISRKIDEDLEAGWIFEKLIFSWGDNINCFDK